MPEKLNELAAEILQKAAAVPPSHRYLLGIVGSPGAGKTTLAGRLVSELNQQRGGNEACVVPMDGFHLRNEILQQRNLRALKGIPETFDAEGFVALIKSLRSVPAVRVGVPGFDRRIDEPTVDAWFVEPHHRTIVIEGNYLLLNEAPWNEIAPMLDETWFLDVHLDTIMPRLIERHVAGGKTPEGAQEKVESTDLRNARLIETTRTRASRVIGGDYT